MPIKFACSSCQKLLRVKDELAGKRAACPSCKKVILIPQASTLVSGTSPTGTTAELKQEELEDLASSLLVERKEAAAQATAVIEMTCPHCDAELKLPENLAGKQAPCPECRRILRVPQLAPGKKRDWQEVAPTGPSLAKRSEEKLEDAWGSDNVTRVSTEALYEAGAIKEVRPPLTAAQWATRIVWVVLGVVVLYGGWTIISNFRASGLQQQATAKLMETEASLSVPMQPEFRRLWAEYHLAQAQRGSTEEANDLRQKAQNQFSLAISALRGMPDDLEKAAVCRALLTTLRDGDFGPEQNRLLGTVLQALPVTGRRHLLRGFCKESLLGKSAESHATMAEELFALVRTEPDVVEQAAAFGILGQELLPQNRTLAIQAAEHGNLVAPNRFVFPLAVLREALNLPSETAPPNNDLRDMVKSEAAARSGRYAEAVQKLKENITLNDLERVQMLLALAEVVGPKDKAEMEKLLTQAQQVVPRDALWERIRIVELTQTMGEGSLAELRAAQLLGESAKGRVQLQQLLRKATQAGGRLETDQVSSITAGPARGLAVYTLARQNASSDPKGAYAWAETQAEYTPFAVLGVLRGMLEPR